MECRANILVVDDELGPRESLRVILSPYYNVFTAERGEEAIEILGQVPVDLVTMDLKLAGPSGIEILENIKRCDQDIEAIIITGYGSMDSAVEGLRLGVFDYVAKPFDVNHILSQVKRALERRNAKVRLKQLKTDFLTNVTHELRTPLSVVMGFVSLLLDQAVGKLTDEQQRVVEKVYKSSEELLGLIDNVLWLSSLNAADASLVLEGFDLGGVVREITEKYRKILEEKSIDLSVQLPPGGIPMHCDLPKVARIFQNLFDNAVKFTPRGQIVIKAHRAMDEGSVALEVHDTGIGIPQDQIDGLFQPFRALDSSVPRQFSGLGIGLAVARRLTEFLAGTIQLKSEPDIGTHVVVTLPARSWSNHSCRGH